MNTKQYPGDFTTHIHQGHEEATVGSGKDAWLDQVDALFKINMISMHTCLQCSRQSRVVNDPDSILLLAIIDYDTNDDGLYAALRKYLHETIEKNCDVCSTPGRGSVNREHSSVAQIMAGPQVLMIHLKLFHYEYDRKQKALRARKTNRVMFPMHLDLSLHQPSVVAETDSHGAYKLVAGAQVMITNTPLKYCL